MAAVLGLDDDAVEDGLRRGPGRRRRRLGGQLQRPRPGRHRRIPRRPRGRPVPQPRPTAPSGSWPCRSAVPSTPRTWPRPRTACDAALAAVRFGDAVVPVAANIDAALHSTAADWPGLLSRQLCRPVRWRQLLAHARRPGRRHVRRARPGHRAHRHGQAHPRRRRNRCRRLPRGGRAPRAASSPNPCSPAAPGRRRAPLRHRAARGQPRSRCLLPRRLACGTVDRSRSARCSAGSVTTRCAPASPAG